MGTGNKPNKEKKELDRHIHVTYRPPPGRRVLHRNSSTGEGGWAPWRPVQSRNRNREELSKASRADQGVRGAMAGQGTPAAMAGRVGT